MGSASIFRYQGRTLSSSKVSPPGEVCVWNANICSKSKGKFWYGDLNLTKDADELKALAAQEGEALYILRERDARFDTADKPRFDRAVCVVEPDGTLTIDEAKGR